MCDVMRNGHPGADILKFSLYFAPLERRIAISVLKFPHFVYYISMH